MTTTLTDDTPSNPDLDALLAYLIAYPRWMSARLIASDTGFNGRKIRSLASSSGGLILSGPGCPGYKHLQHASAKEVNETYSRLRNQARSMLSRAIAVQRAYHAAPYK